jgi:multimeric flavodoxin WrbA
MQITAVLGSPHGMKGNTGSVLAALLDGARQAGAKTQTFSLDRYEVRPCRACDVCHRTGDCAVDDDFAAVRDAMLAADGIVLASPNYMHSVTGQMKCLMDRCCSPYHLHALNGKYGAAVVTAGGPEAEPVETYLLRFLRAMGCWTVGGVGVEASNLMTPDEKHAAMDWAREVGQRLATAIRDHATFPEQDPEREACGERMRQLVIMRRDEWVYEYETLKSRGLV